MSVAGAGLRRWTERWWGGRAGPAGRVADRVLAPAEALYRTAVTARAAGYERGWLVARRAPLPVISVGNLAVGGSGKTPFAAWLAGDLRASGERPAVLLRGYGGDEVLLHREINPAVPVFANPDRLTAAGAAAQVGCTVAVLDDGFQHLRLRRDLDLVLVSVTRWRRDLRLLPRGPWRERPAALRRADAIVAVSRDAGGDELAAAAADLADASGRPVVQCRIVARTLRSLGEPAACIPLARFGGTSVLAVSAIADPAAFQRNLEGGGMQVESAVYPDHHPFSAADALRLAHTAVGRPLVTTHKDAVKLRTLLPAGTDAWVLEQQVEIVAEGDRLGALIRDALPGGRG